jgi:carbonic anhydrase
MGHIPNGWRTKEWKEFKQQNQMTIWISCMDEKNVDTIRI